MGRKPSELGPERGTSSTSDLGPPPPRIVHEYRPQRYIGSSQANDLPILVEWWFHLLVHRTPFRHGQTSPCWPLVTDILKAVNQYARCINCTWLNGLLCAMHIGQLTQNSDGAQLAGCERRQPEDYASCPARDSMRGTGLHDGDRTGSGRESPRTDAIWACSAAQACTRGWTVNRPGARSVARYAWVSSVSSRLAFRSGRPARRAAAASVISAHVPPVPPGQSAGGVCAAGKHPAARPGVVGGMRPVAWVG